MKTTMYEDEIAFCKKVIASGVKGDALKDAQNRLKVAEAAIKAAQAKKTTKKHIRIYVSPMGHFADSSTYEFVAEFESEKLAEYYMHYMRNKSRYSDKDIIFQEVTVTDTESGELTKKGEVVCIISVLGECLRPEEWLK